MPAAGAVIVATGGTFVETVSTASLLNRLPALLATFTRKRAVLSANCGDASV